MPITLPAILVNAKSLRQTMTDAEQKLWYYLRAERYFKVKFKRQVPIGRYIADFAALQVKLIIELDGGQHPEQKVYDQKRDAYFKHLGFYVFRVWNHEIFEGLDAVLDEIAEILSQRGKAF